ncbi:hypothetical protein KVT40_007844 [Elsinoe batatas]|uniref:Uncharacterized protein n=1 Tax=Elsinoe batatas TaxID=2601811 RepID=A0A8K0KWE4_9PEZI|nr:hypothetical protein KVT40_007844 [Elsinoe batatas]
MAPLPALSKVKTCKPVTAGVEAMLHHVRRASHTTSPNGKRITNRKAYGKDKSRNLFSRPAENTARIGSAHTATTSTSSSPRRPSPHSAAILKRNAHLKHYMGLKQFHKVAGDVQALIPDVMDMLDSDLATIFALQAMNASHKMTEEEIEQLEQEFAETKAALDSTEASLKTSQEDLEKASAKFADKEKEFQKQRDASQKIHDSEISSKDRDIKQLTSANEGLKSKNQKLTGTNEELNSMIQKLQQEIQQKSSEIISLNDKVADVTKLYEQKTDLSETLIEEKSNVQSQLDTANEEINSLENEKTHIANQHASAIQALNSQHAAAIEALKTQQAKDIESLKSQYLSTIKYQQSQHDSTVQDLQSQLATANEKCSQRSEEMMDMDSEDYDHKVDLGNQLASVNNTCTQLQQEVSRIQSQLDQRNKEWSEATAREQSGNVQNQQHLSKLQSQLAEKSNLIVSLTSQRDAAEKKAELKEMVERKSFALHDKYKQLDARYNQLEAEHKVAQDRIVAYDEKLEEIKPKLANVESQVKAHVETNKALSERNNLLERTANSSDQDLYKLKFESEAFKQCVEDALSRLSGISPPSPEAAQDDMDDITTMFANTSNSIEDLSSPEAKRKLFLQKLNLVMEDFDQVKRQRTTLDEHADVYRESIKKLRKKQGDEEFKHNEEKKQFESLRVQVAERNIQVKVLLEELSNYKREALHQQAARSAPAPRRSDAPRDVLAPHHSGRIERKRPQPRRADRGAVKKQGKATHRLSHVFVQEESPDPASSDPSIRDADDLAQALMSHYDEFAEGEDFVPLLDFDDEEMSFPAPFIKQEESPPPLPAQSFKQEGSPPPFPTREAFSPAPFIKQEHSPPPWSPPPYTEREQAPSPEPESQAEQGEAMESSPEPGSQVEEGEEMEE